MKNMRLPSIRWLKPKEAGAYLGISLSSVRRILRRMQQDTAGKYGVIRNGRIVRVREDILTKFLTGGE